MTKFTDLCSLDPRQSYEPWPWQLLRALPEFLTALLQQSHAQSLERLQLVSMSIQRLLGHAALGRGFSDIELVLPQAHEPLELTGIFSSEEEVFRVSLRYKNKSKKPLALPVLGSAEGPPTPFTVALADISNFFTSLEQVNDHWSNPELALLYGQTAILVPHQMMIACLLLESLKRRSKPESLTDFTISFFKAIKVDKPLSLVESKDSHHLDLAIIDDGVIAIYLRAV